MSIDIQITLLTVPDTKRITTIDYTILVRVSTNQACFIESPQITRETKTQI